VTAVVADEAQASAQGRWDALDDHLGLAWKSVLLVALTLAAFRAALLLAHGSRGLPYPGADLGRAFAMGSRFDLKVAAILLGPPLLLIGVARSLAGPRWRRRLAAAATGWAAFAFAACDLLAIGNHFYYAFFHSPINPIVFGLAEDDTAAVLKTVWNDQPVLRAGLGLAALLWLQLRLLRLVPVRLSGGAARIAAVALTAGALLFLARGRLGTFPLRDFDLVVSSSPFVNDLVPSGPEALFVAWQQRNEAGIEGGLDAGLRRLGFASPLEAAAAMGIRAGSEAELLDALYPPARPNPEAAARPPHVVLALMESWGAHLLEFHSARNDLMGRLAPHLSDGTLFRHFSQIQDGTNGTVEGLLLATPISPLTYAQYGYRVYDTSAALPFARRGYRTVFLTSGTGGWRNLRRVLPRQGFAEFYDEHDVLRAFPAAARHTWGVHDGPMFELASQLLVDADHKGQRLFLVILSTSNHPPHQVPPDYVLRPLDLAVIGGRVAAAPELARAILATTQYASDALGGFLDRLDEVGLGGRTVVAATGDHNVRSFFAYPEARDLPRKVGVPLLLHVPAAYRGGRSFDPDRFASPRDLIPTLAGLSIPGERVFASGRDLLLPAPRARALSGFDLVLSADGVVAGLRQPRLFAWAEGGTLVPCETEACRAPLQRLEAEERAYVALLDWNIRRQALKRPRAP
jgi:hypothetical protein